MTHEFTVTYTRVKSHAVLGQILVDPAMPEDAIHLYRVRGDAVVLDKTIQIGADEKSPADAR